jgi:hypothetical protein
MRVLRAAPLPSSMSRMFVPSSYAMSRACVVSTSASARMT